MSGGEEDRSSRELEQLTTSIREMASRVNAEFILDDHKTQNYIAAQQLRVSKDSEQSGR